MRIFLSGLSHVVGKAYPIQSLQDEIPDDLMRHLADGGIRIFRKAEASPAVLAFESLESTIAATGLELRDLSLVFFCSTKLDEDADDIGRFMELLGSRTASHVPVIGLSLGRCTNPVAAIEMARALIKAGTHKHIAVLTADGIRDGMSRIVQANSSVFSDGAASCLISENPTRGFEVLGIGLWSDRSLRRQTAISESSMQKTALGIRKAFDAAASDADVVSEDIDKMFCLNLVAPLTRFLAKHCGIDKSRVYTNSLPEMGHVFSADILINMQSYLNEGISNKRPLLALASGDSVWGAMVLRQCL